MQRIVSRSALVLIAALAAPCSLAQDVAPDLLLQAVTREVIAIIGQDKDIQAGNPEKVAELVETRILPLFDFTRMTRLAVARNWRLATPGQQEELTLEFKTLLVRTYSTALSSYHDQVIEYKPLRVALAGTRKPGCAVCPVKAMLFCPWQLSAGVPGYKPCQAAGLTSGADSQST
jgi:phospholipid transport system substrate-binding protein